MSSPLRVLFDGWALIRHPGSPAALHLLAILENIPSEVQPVVAVPEAPPEWFPQFPIQIQETANQFTWEQNSLPRLARRLDADLLHLFSASAPLFGGSRAVVSPCSFDPIGLHGPLTTDEGKESILNRARQSIQLGGLARARTLFLPNDLDTEELQTNYQCLPPLVHSSFTPPPQLEDHKRHNGSGGVWNELRQVDLPDTYLLYHGPASTPAVIRLLNAWRWASNAIGNYHPLLLLGFNAAEQALFNELAKPYGFGETVRVLPELSFPAIAMLYQGCTALFHPATEPLWGGPIRHALACGKPVVASHYLQTNRLVGPAAYLAPENDHRALGAALITVIVEEEVSEKLAQAARQRASTWNGIAYSQALLAAYQKVTTSR